MIDMPYSKRDKRGEGRNEVSIITRKIIFTFSFILLCLNLAAQSITDSIFTLKEIEIKAYFAPQPLMFSPSSAFVVDNNIISQQAGSSLLPALNIVPGVRMEERSPGSYRLSIRGSLLRSPFGVRNVKVYMDQFPLTDASGFTYLNALDINTVSSIEILKGPDGSLFGANSGGVILFNLFEKETDSAANKVEIQSGSFGLFHENVIVRSNQKNYDLKISQGYQKSDGYRENSSMERNFFQAEQRFRYSPKNELKALLFYSDYGYKTPGGLTRAQMDSDPRSARFATPVMPGAIGQQAGVRNQMLFGGVSNNLKINDRIQHSMAVFGSRVNFGNVAIANIEDKTENTAGFRTYIEISGRKDALIDWQWETGFEFQQTHAKIKNYGNSSGIRDTLQAANRLIVGQNFFFTRFYASISDRLNLEGAVSVNDYRYRFGPYESTSQLTSKSFKTQLMPKLGLTYKITNNIAWRATLSKGFSPPTIDEIRSNDNIVNTALQPEIGWNVETGIRIRERSNRIWGEALIFKYELRNAIVRRMNTDNTEYFDNVGGTNQLGFETTLNIWIFEPGNSGFIRGMQLRSSYTLSRFNFTNFIQLSENYSGNKLTGVPDHMMSNSLSINFPAGLYLFAQYNYTSTIPLNDANSVFAEDYNLVRLKAGCVIKKFTDFNIEFYMGIDNLLNETYSLGNDLNAMGQRYFNPSPVRNYLGGIILKF